MLYASADPATDRVPCEQEDPGLWFAHAAEAVNRAKALCRGCPIRLACLAGALERKEVWGVWGGEIVRRGAITQRPPDPSE